MFPNIDQRSYSDLVEECRRRIQAQCPEWTNFSAGDPGVALVEAFAWLADTLLYRINRTPELAYRHLLSVLGIEPRPARAAVTPLVFLMAPGAPSGVVVPARTPVATVGENARIVFTTTEEVTFRPCRMDVLARMLGDEVIDVAGPDGATQLADRFDDTIARGGGLLFGFDGDVSSHAVRLDLEYSGHGIGPSWGGEPTWEALVGGVWTPVRRVRGPVDRNPLPRGTVVALPARLDVAEVAGIPRRWVRLVLPPAAAGDRWPGVRASAECVGVVAPAEHAEEFEATVIGISNGEAGQCFALPGVDPLLAPRPDDLVLAPDPYEAVASFASSRQFDRHVVWDLHARLVRFGPAIAGPDGTLEHHGAVPPAGTEIAVSGYRTGGGVSGNVGAGSLQVLLTTVPWCVAVEQPFAATGGRDVENDDALLARAPLALRSPHQLVTADDHERAVLDADPAVARVRCLRPQQPGAPVRLLVVPHDGLSAEDRFGPPTLGADQIAAISALIERRRHVGATVTVGPPRYRAVSVVVLLQAAPLWGRSAAAGRAQAEIIRLLDPLEGGSNRSGWPFGRRIRASEIAAVLAELDEVDDVDEVLLFDVDPGTGRRSGGARTTIGLDDDELPLGCFHKVVAR